MLDDSMFDEFKIEAEEMLDESEDLLLELEKGEAFEERYNGIFRAFHSLKGAAGMFGLEELQKHMHSLESLFEKLKDLGRISKEQCDYFLRGVDEAKSFLNGQSINFESLSEAEFFALAGESISSSEGEGGTADSSEREVVIESDGEYEYEYEYVEVDAEEEEEEFSEYLQKNTQSGTSILQGKIVIVDDEPDIVEILTLMMEDAGFEVVSFTSSTELLEKIEDISPDLILSDINMPELNGIEMIKRINDILPDLPVIFISGFLSKEIVLEGLSNGVFSYIEKPFKEGQVVGIATQAIIKYRTLKLLNKSLNYILYQYNDLDKFLLEQGKTSIRDAMRTELKQILEQKKMLQSIMKR